MLHGLPAWEYASRLCSPVCQNFLLPYFPASLMRLMCCIPTLTPHLQSFWFSASPSSSCVFVCCVCNCKYVKNRSSPQFLRQSIQPGRVAVIITFARTHSHPAVKLKTNSSKPSNPDGHQLDVPRPAGFIFITLDCPLPLPSEDCRPGIIQFFHCSVFSKTACIAPKSQEQEFSPWLSFAYLLFFKAISTALLKRSSGNAPRTTRLFTRK